MAEISLLADRVDSIPALARWFRHEWPGYYAGRTLGSIEKDFRRELNRASLPIRLVAYDEGLLAGTVVFRERAIDTDPQYAPGLGGLYVNERCRRRGIGTELVRAAVARARELNHPVVYAATATAGGLLERNGWQHIDTILHGAESLGVYRSGGPPS